MNSFIDRKCKIQRSSYIKLSLHLIPSYDLHQKLRENSSNGKQIQQPFIFPYANKCQTSRKLIVLIVFKKQLSCVISTIFCCQINKCDKITCPFGCNKCVSESQCIECFEGAELIQGKCQCKEGYKTTPGLNYCFELICPIGCKTCQTTFECQECFSRNSRFIKEQNKCDCQNDYINVDFQNECIHKNKVIEQNFYYNLQKAYNQSFVFCKGTSFNYTLLDQDIALVFSDDRNQKLKYNMRKIGLNAFASIIALNQKQMRGNLYYNHEILSPGKFRREMKDASFNISTEQGSVRNSLDRYVGFDIRDPESLYHFNLIINCGNVDELSNEQINELLDNYFGLFYVCPPNCKDCAFEGETIKCQKCIDQFNLTDDGKCKYKYLYNKCEKPHYPSQNNTCILVVNDELLICSKKDKCYNCLDQRIEINFMDTDSCTCKKGYYLDQKKLECLNCEDLCEECEFRKSYCQKCKVSAYLDYETNKCKLCEIRNCQQCESDKICKDCQSGYYLDNQNSACTKCKIPNCKTCQNENVCINAQSGYYVDNDKILVCQQANCDICDSSTCKVCKEGFIINTKINICEQCEKGCKLCQLEGGKKCKIPYSGFYIDFMDDLKCKNCIQNCENCYMAYQCNKCYEGMPEPTIIDNRFVCSCKEKEFYDATQKRCITCSNNCINCEDKKYCTQCETGYFINNNKQCQKCLTDCDLCKDEKQCFKCSYDKIMSKDKDKCSCMVGCQVCNKEIVKEDNKKKNYKMEQTKEENKSENDKGKENKEETKKEDKKSEEKKGDDQEETKKDDEKKNEEQPTEIEQEVCTKSLSGYYLVEQKAVQCELGCKECDNKDNCIYCDVGYYKQYNQNKCLKCIENCKNCNDQLKCDACYTGYYLKDNKCNKCDNCSECKYENEKIKCTKCTQSMYLENEQCIEGNCMKPLKKGKCDSCNNGYYLDNQKCKKCNENCQQCDKNNCKKCDDAYYAEGSQCLKCPDFCPKCYLRMNQMICQSCVKDYKLNSQNKCEKTTSPVLILSLIALLPFACLSYFLCNRKQKFFFNQLQEPKVQELTDQTENDLELPSSQFMEPKQEQ